MNTKQEKIRVGDLVVYTRKSHDYPEGIDMGMGIVIDTDGRISVYWPWLWGRDICGIAMHPMSALLKVQGISG